MRNGTAVTSWQIIYIVVPYRFFDHSFLCRPEVRRDSVDAGGSHEAQNPRNLVRIDTAVNIDLGIDRIDQTRKVGRYRNKEGDSSTPILCTRGMTQCEVIGINQTGERTTPPVYR